MSSPREITMSSVRFACYGVETKVNIWRQRLSIPLPQLADEYEKKEKCGLFGIWGTPAASQIYISGPVCPAASRAGIGGDRRLRRGAPERPHRDGAGQPGLYSADASGGTGRPRGHRARPLFHDRLEQTVQRPAAAAAISAGAGGGGAQRQPDQRRRCCASNTRNTGIFSRARRIRKSSCICWPSRRMRRSTIRCRTC